MVCEQSNGGHGVTALPFQLLATGHQPLVFRTKSRSYRSADGSFFLVRRRVGGGLSSSLVSFSSFHGRVFELDRSKSDMLSRITETFQRNRPHFKPGFSILQPPNST